MFIFTHQVGEVFFVKENFHAPPPGYQMVRPLPCLPSSSLHYEHDESLSGPGGGHYLHVKINVGCEWPLFFSSSLLQNFPFSGGKMAIPHAQDLITVEPHLGVNNQSTKIHDLLKALYSDVEAR